MGLSTPLVLARLLLIFHAVHEAMAPSKPALDSQCVQSRSSSATSSPSLFRLSKLSLIAVNARTVDFCSFRVQRRFCEPN